MSHSKNYSIKRSVFEAANKVYTELSCERDRPVYLDALEAEFSRVNALHAERAPAIPVYYKGRKLPHTLTADFRLFGKAIVYVTVTNKVTNEAKTALYKRMLATAHPVGFILNFGKSEPDFCRLYVEAGLPGDRASGLAMPFDGEKAVREDGGRGDEGKL